MSSGTKPSIWGFSSAGRALAWHARGHRFDPGNLHQKEKHCTGMCSVFLLCLPSYAAAKFMLDICGKLWYNSFCNCGYSTSASISAFQAEEVGSIPIARSIKKSLDSLKSRLFSFAITHYLTHFCFLVCYQPGFTSICQLCFSGGSGALSLSWFQCRSTSHSSKKPSFRR